MTLPVRLRPLVWLFALLVAAWGLRAPFLQREIWNLDEGSTFTMAQQILDGDVLYQDAADNRGPLVPYLKAAVFFVAGDWNIHAVHAVLALALGLVAFLLWDLARRLGDEMTGRWAAGAFTVLAFVYPGFYDSLAAHTEWFVVLFSSLGFWWFARTWPAGGFRAGLGTGLAFGAGVLCKQPGLLDFGVTWVLLALFAWHHPAARARCLRLWLGSLTGAAALFAATLAYFAWHGALDDLAYYAWTFNTRLYVPEVPLLARWSIVRMPFELAWLHAPVAGLAGVGGALLLLRIVFRRTPAGNSAGFPTLSWLILGWSAAGLVSTMLSGREFSHYAIQFLPGLSLATGWSLSRLATLATRSETRSARAVGIGLLAVVVAASAFDLVRFWRKLAPQADAHLPVLADFVQRYSPATDRLLVWGYYPEAYVISRRLPSTRFIYTNYLTGMIPWTNLDKIDTRYAVVPGAWDAFWHDYHARPPSVILDAVMRGYQRYPLFSQIGLRDEVVDHFAEMERPLGESLNARLYRRLVPVSSRLLPAEAPLDSALRLAARHIPGNPDLVSVSVDAPGVGGKVTVRLGQRLYRALDLGPTQPLAATFLVRVADLTAPNAFLVDAVLERGGRFNRSPPLDIIRHLTLDVRPFEPTPILADSVRRLAPAQVDPSAWRPEPRGESMGWSTATPFTLGFPRRPEMQILRLQWQPPALAAAYPEITFIADSGARRVLAPVVTQPVPGRHDLEVGLPPDQPGRIEFHWPGTPGDALTASVWIGEIAGSARGPELVFNDQIIPPAVAVSRGRPLVRAPDGSWRTAAPARIVYPRRPYMNAVVVDYGFDDRVFTDAATQPGEVVLEVNYLHEDGRRENLVSDLMRPRLDPGSRGRRSTRLGLPPNSPGEIEIKFAPVYAAPDSDTYLLPLRVQGPGPDLLITPDRILTPLSSETSDGQPIHSFVAGKWIAHAPGHLVYACPADLASVTFSFGLDEASYPSTNGIDVSVEFRDDAEKSLELFRRRLDPRSVPGDRGLQSARVELPGRVGRLIFHMSPGRDNDASYDWSYWTNFTGEASPPVTP